jgi:hypothetical protein
LFNESWNFLIGNGMDSSAQNFRPTMAAPCDQAFRGRAATLARAHPMPAAMRQRILDRITRLKQELSRGGPKPA